MKKLQDRFTLSVSRNKMEAYIEMDSRIEDSEMSNEEIQRFLEDQGLVYGVDGEAIEQLTARPDSVIFPLQIACGTEPQHGKPGKIIFDRAFTMEIEARDKVSFRDVINIPSVTKGERIARILPPTKGVSGRNVYGEELPATPGMPPRMRAGKNVTYQTSDASFYSELTGQLSYDEKSLKVLPLFKVTGDLNLKTGNLDFVGSIEINGNVPSGFQLKAGGDIKILGMVEGAEITAGGSVYVAEGVSGLGKAVIQAGLDIRVGYINQAQIEAGQHLFVENSILHSHCVAKDSIFCQKGNIIGGTLSAGVRIEAKDIGNRMSTPTGLYLGVNKKVEEKVKKFTNLKNQKLEEKSKLHKLGEMLINKINQGEVQIKDKITLLRQKNSLSSVEEEIEDLTRSLSDMDAVMGEHQGARVEVSGTLFANTSLGFGRYQYKVKETKQKVFAILEEGEIMIHQKT